MIFILETISILIAWFFTIALFTLIFDGKDAFKRNRK
jgi:hypothetical protein